MIFKSIEMFGFKSFADKIDITFEGGITGIIGPNGCGKSNVADAIRWVLGEQSTKLLRGTSMQDVIFNGTEKRKNLSYSEVSLHFDNSERLFNIDYNELVIARKLYRSGESEYNINREPCRLKDIVSILHDVGIGKEGYSIIGQGKVEEIISSKPENRRAIFEEAVGIAKHKASKLESERKLERTRENLTRVTDIKTEIERQLGPLAKQAETAKKYLELKESLKIYEVNNYIYQYEKASDIKYQINEKIQGLTEEINVKTLSLNKTNEDYALAMQEVNKIDLTLSKLHEDVLNLTVAIEKHAGESKLYEERLSFLKDQKIKFEEQLKTLNFQIENNSNEKIKRQTSLISKEKSLAELKKKTEEVMETYLAVVDELTAGETAVNLSQKQMIDSLDNLAGVKASLSRLEAEKEANELALKDIRLKLELIGGKILDDQKRKSELKKEFDKAEKDKAEANADLNNTLKLIDENDAKIDKLESDENLLNSRISSLVSRYKILTEMQTENEGYQASIRKLLNDAKTQQKLSSCILGTVAGLFKVDKQFEVAIEMALGSAVGNIVTSNEEDAKKLINHLKENNYGRATMLPLTSIKPRFIDGFYNNAINKLSFGVASSLISFDKKYQKVFDSLLGGTVIAKNLDVAIELAKQTKYSFKIVTLEGDVINSQGSLTGGSKKSEGIGLLSREREITSLKDEILKTKQNLEGISKQKEQDIKIQTELHNKQQKLTSVLTNAEVLFAKINEQYLSVEGSIQGLTEQKESLLDNQRKITQKIAEIETSITMVIAKQSELSGNKTVANEVIESRQKQFDNLKIKRDEYNENITSLKVQIASLESEIQSINQELTRLSASEEELADLKSNCQDNIKKADKAIADCQTITLSIASSEGNEENAKKLTIVKEKLAGVEIYKKEKQAEFITLDEERQKLNNELNRVQDKKYHQEIALSKVDTDIEVMQDRVFEDYELTYATALNYKEMDYNFDFGNKEATNLRRQISALGNVNVNAIEDSKELGERYVLYKTQEEDLLKAEIDIIEAIRQLSNEMIKKFNTEFELIQMHFSKIFKELFGGGNAKLVLLESEDPLNAGIEIIAEPPGKKLQSITLLSGGEKALTAIAILFAILKLRPMPFCLLDEIDAALDDSNVVRFASYLKRFSNETQFIIITHKKATMELADSLYGVTMEEKGVSKIVSVKLSEAVEKAEAK